MKAPHDVLNFWFDQLAPADWWVKSAEMDQRIGTEFGATLSAAAAGECWAWRESDHGRLAEIIVLDQFSRNIYRDTAGAFTNDPLALCLSQQAIALNLHNTLASDRAAFLAMPYMHSESAIIHSEAEGVFSQIGNPGTLEFERKHKEIIDRFGRYPHRNFILGRQSSAEEVDFLSQPGSSF